MAGVISPNKLLLAQETEALMKRIRYTIWKTAAEFFSFFSIWWWSSPFVAL